MEDLQKISENKLKSASSGQEVSFKSLWEDQPCVITFFRRWGCGFCRLAARDLSNIKPHLDSNNVRLIGVGVEDLGVEDFVNGNYFNGDLYIDTEKKSYADLGYKRYGILTIIPALATKTSRDAIFKAKAENVGGDMKGDKYQVGGTLVVSKGGKEVLLHHKQESLADHVNPADVLKSLGIEADIQTDNKNNANPITCDTTACELTE